MKRALVIEFHNHHAETLPSWTYILAALGYSTDVLTTKANIQRDPFALVAKKPKQTRKLGLVALALFRLKLGRLLTSSYDLVVFNSVEPEHLLKRAFELGQTPCLVVLHNAIHLRTKEGYQRLGNNNGPMAVVLQPFIASNYLGDERSFLCPYFLTDQIEAKTSQTIFCVQGTFDYSRRNYETLLSALIQFKTERLSGFKVRFVGNVRPDDYYQFVNRCRLAGVMDFLDFMKGGHDYANYLKLVGESDFILPLLEPQISILQPYFDYSASSSLSMGVGLGVVPILNSDLAELYGLGGASITYRRSEELFQAMKTALNLSGTERQSLATSLLSYRDLWLSRSVEGIGSILHPSSEMTGTESKTSPRPGI